MIAVKGHGLQREGRPYWQEECSDCLPGEHRRQDWDGNLIAIWTREGHSICACGWVGLHDTSTRGRQAQHRAHKQDILDMQEKTP